MFKKIFQSFKKSRQLKEVSTKLSKPLDTSDIFKSIRGRKDALIELIDIAESDENVKAAMNEYHADRQTLNKLYDKLALVGAGQYAGGHYVAASSLVYPSTLKYLLEHFNNGIFSIKNWDDNNSSIHIAYRLIEYFEKGETGEIK